MKLLFLLFLESYISLLLLSVYGIDLNEYLDEKLRQSKIEFIKIHIEETSPVQEKSYRVHWDRSWRIPIMSDHQPFTINILDGVFIIDNNRVMAPSLNATHWNETYDTLREIYRIRKESIKFIRSITWKDISYLLICYESNLCSIYTAKSNHPLRFRHTMGYKGSPVDAKFFIHADQLYLIIANNANKFPVPSVLYRWSGTYMDIVDEIMITSAVSVTAFEYRRSTIIVFAQSYAENPWTIDSEVYEFKDGNIVRIQLLSTATSHPTSVHHYVHGDFNFILMINDLGPSNVFCWDGGELLNWFSLPIKPHSLINIFHMDGDTFVVVAYDNIVQLYKFHSTSDWKSENVKRFKDTQKIVDMIVSLDENTMNVTLILAEKNVYWVEQWEVEMTSIPIDNNMNDTDTTRKCLADLIEMLQARMPVLKEAKASWKFLLPAAKNLTVLEPVNFDSLILRSGTVDNVEFATEEDILSPHRIANALTVLDRDVHDVVQAIQQLKSQQEKMVIANMETFKEKIIAHDVYLEELEIDQMYVDFVNDVNMSKKINLLEAEQQFTNILHAKNTRSLIVHDLEVESLCGIPSEYWMLQNDEGIASAIGNSHVEYTNDTLILHSDLIIPKLKIKSLNGTIINQLIDDLFIINRPRKIKGTITYKNSLQVMNLTAQMVNGVSADKLMTMTTNQSFDDFYAKELHIENLYAERINGVPVEEIARKSRENVIKGKLKLEKLIVTENLVIDMNESMIKMPDEWLQIYQNVTLLGNLYVQNIEVADAAKLFVGNIPVNVTDMFDRYWTKSTDQTITAKITLEAGITIDKLNTKYLNGFAESDFLYTTMEEIPSDFTNLRFENFYVHQFFHENGSNDNFFEVEPNSLTIREKLHVQTLRAKDIITLTFNGVNVDDIMNETRVYFPNAELPAVQARRVFVDNLDVRFLNRREVFFEDGLHINDDHQLTFLKVPEFHVRNLEVERLNGIELNQTRLRDLMSFDPIEVVIDGDLIVQNLTVDQVDGQATESFLEELSQSDIVITSERNIEHLVVQNITLESLCGRNFDDWIASVLSKSKEQTITGHFFADIVTSDNITVDFINKRNASQLMWVNEPLTITGNVTFTDLFVEGDVITPKMNGYNVNELYDSLLYIPAKSIDLLEVYGNISWDTNSTSPTSISYLLNNAVTKDKDQVITGEVIFEKDLRAWAVSGNYTDIQQIQHIISDAVIDYGEFIEINGTKIFEEDLAVNNLIVNGDLGIVNINDVNILEFNDSVVRQNSEDTIVGPLIFLADVIVEKLYVNDADLNASVNAAVRSNEVMPDNIYFEELEVLGDVNLQNLNKIDFDNFVKNRVTLDGDHDIACNVQFNGIVTVTGNANIKKINGIYPSDFVLNNVDEVQIINGIKTFKEDLVVNGDVIAPRINNVDIMEKYNDGVQNIGNVDIFGDLIFKEDIRIQNISTSGLVNGMNLHSIVNYTKKKINETFEDLEKHWRIIEQNIEYSSQISETLRNIFFYLEEEEDLEIPGTNVSKIDVVYFDENTIRLNMYREQPGRFCGLLDNCSCTYQSVIDLVKFNGTNRTMREWRVNFEMIVKNFHNPGEMFDVNVMTNAVSSSKECTLTGTRPEYTTISLTTIKNLKMNYEDISHKIEGYLKDAKIFKHDGDMYIVLAIYYDKVRATHRTNSLLYRVNSMENATLIQEIATDGAWSIQIFNIDYHEIFLLIGCFGESLKSSLYRFNPMTRKFEQLRTFASRSRYVKSLSQGKDYFILLDNPDTNAVNIYKYDSKYRNFYSYQSIFHFHQINGIEYFYTDEFGNSDVFVIVTTQSGQFYIYEYMFAGKFQMKMQHAVNGLRTIMPFYHMNNHYILAGTDDNNVIFRIVKQGPH